LVFLGEMRAPGAHLEHLDHGRADASGTRQLVAALVDLPPQERLALTLHYLENLTDAEIGGLVDVDPRRVANLRRSALTRIAKAG
jgi:DNA-directed RNA polymerase specialized sigma24 family protein